MRRCTEAVQLMRRTCNNTKLHTFTTLPIVHKRTAGVLGSKTIGDDSLSNTHSGGKQTGLTDINECPKIQPNKTGEEPSHFLHGCLSCASKRPRCPGALARNCQLIGTVTRGNFTTNCSSKDSRAKGRRRCLVPLRAAQRSCGPMRMVAWHIFRPGSA